MSPQGYKNMDLESQDPIFNANLGQDENLIWTKKLRCSHSIKKTLVPITGLIVWFSAQYLLVTGSSSCLCHRYQQHPPLLLAYFGTTSRVNVISLFCELPLSR